MCDTSSSCEPRRCVAREYQYSMIYSQKSCCGSTLVRVRVGVRVRICLGSVLVYRVRFGFGFGVMVLH